MTVVHYYSPKASIESWKYSTVQKWCWRIRL